MIEATPLSISEEHQFWLEVLQDHVCFLLDRMGPQESEWIAEGLSYKKAFANLVEKLGRLPEPSHATSKQWIVYAKEVHSVAAGYYKLEGQLQALQIAGYIQLGLTPAFLNSTLTENQEYLRLLQYYVQGADAPALPLWNLMDLWLGDQLSHTEMIQQLLHPIEPSLSKEAEALAAEFRSHLIHNKAIHGFLRFTSPDFPEQIQFAREAAASVIRLYQLLIETISRMSRTAFLDRGSLHLLEHQIPEASYFMRKLAYWIPNAPGLVTNHLSKSSTIS